MLQHARRGCRTCWSWGLNDICGSLIQSETYLLGAGHLLSEIKANEPVSIDIAGKSALKMANLHNLKVIRPKWAKILLCKGEKFYRRLYAVRVVACKPALYTFYTTSESKEHYQALFVLGTDQGLACARLSVSVDVRKKRAKSTRALKLFLNPSSPLFWSLKQANLGQNIR